MYMHVYATVTPTNAATAAARLPEPPNAFVTPANAAIAAARNATGETT